jgi:dTDP-4-amino-4,6-dideoxygalactose transaminase
MGLCNLSHIDEIHEKRKAICDAYDSAFFSHQSSAIYHQLSSITYRNEASRNYSYYPVLFDSEQALLTASEVLESKGIYARRYFWPCLHTLCGTDDGHNVSISRDIAQRILCLPLSASIEDEDLKLITSTLV